MQSLETECGGDTAQPIAMRHVAKVALISCMRQGDQCHTGQMLTRRSDIYIDQKQQADVYKMKSQVLGRSSWLLLGMPRSLVTNQRASIRATAIWLARPSTHVTRYGGPSRRTQGVQAKPLCKIQIPAIGGGETTSNTSGRCMQASACRHEVERSALRRCQIIRKGCTKFKPRACSYWCICINALMQYCSKWTRSMQRLQNGHDCTCQKLNCT
jgi:hypothetical protein